jgi:colicin import membrane protein
MSIINLTPTQLRQAADIQEEIAGLKKQLAAFENNKTVAPAAAKPAKKKGGMSAAGKARIAAAQKLRWAKIHAAKGKPAAAPKPVKKARRKMSAEARAKIAAAAKARWAKVRAEKAAKK